MTPKRPAPRWEHRRHVKHFIDLFVDKRDEIIPYLNKLSPIRAALITMYGSEQLPELARLELSNLLRTEATIKEKERATRAEKQTNPPKNKRVSKKATPKGKGR